MATKLLVFGGSFDPPHLGHMNLLRNAVAAVAPDVVLVVPSGTAPHKHASQTPGPLRAQMCACFEAVFPGVVVDETELHRTGKSYTVDTLLDIAGRYPGAALHLCIGGDMLRSFTTWHRWQDILNLATLVVAGRQPDEAPALMAAAEALRVAGGRVLFAGGPVVQASSTAIRQALAEGDEAVFRLIPPPADAIIRQHHLYVGGN